MNKTKTSAKSKIAFWEKTKEMLGKYRTVGIINKKVLVIFGIFVVLAIGFLLVFSAGWRMRAMQNFYGQNVGFGNGANMINRGKYVYPLPAAQDSANQFVIPEDAAKSGEIAIVVNDLETAKKAVLAAAVKGGGSVYATFISYVSGNLKNGSMVVQVPVENFEATFEALKGVGSKVVQESSRQIEPRNIAYPMMTPATSAQEQAGANSASAQPAANSAENKQANVDQQTAASAPAIAVWPQPQQIQNKGYIRVVFADYGNAQPVGTVGSTTTLQQTKRGLWAVFMAESLLLIILFVVLILMLRKIFSHFRSIRKTKPTVHIVRQMPKTRQRVIRIQKKK
ncbi:MAG: hypothetical protein PHW24_03620 [Candidatus Moranbacteria bacterium]|nr:hypothetical protein [Candidatus Moranbacteria bacterium]